MADERKSDTTSDYSASKAPETQRHADKRDPEDYKDWRLIPGGRRGSPEPNGMNALHRKEVPSEALPPKQTDFGDLIKE